MKQIKYYLGIDGGGTATRGCLINSTGQCIATAKAGATNYLRKDEDIIMKRILELIRTLNAAAGLSGDNKVALGVGLSGLGTPDLRSRFKKLLEKTNCAAEIMVESDAAAALTGAFIGGAGAILIAGTGSIAYGKSPDGKIFRAGGWGYLLGPEGAGFDIARNGIAAALKDWDGRGEQTMLREKFESCFAVKSINEAVPEIYVNYATRGALAKFAPVVFEAARAGDKIAKKIIEAAATCLAQHISALAKKLKQPDVLQLALLGNIFKSKQQLLPTMHKCWSAAGCQIRIVEPQFSAEIGAAILTAPELFANQEFAEKLKKSVAARQLQR